MKKLLVVLALLSSNLFAQNNQAKQKATPQERIEKLVVELNLDEQQANRAQQILTEHHLKLKQLKESTKGDAKLMRPEMQSLRKDLNVKMRAVLNQEQYADYKRIQSHKQMNKKRPNKKPRHGSKRRI